MTVDTFQTLTALRPGSHLIRLRRPRWVCLGEAQLSEPRRAQDLCVPASAGERDIACDASLPRVKPWSGRRAMSQELVERTTTHGTHSFFAALTKGATDYSIHWWRPSHPVARPSSTVASNSAAPSSLLRIVMNSRSPKTGSSEGSRPKMDSAEPSSNAAVR